MKPFLKSLLVTIVTIGCLEAVHAQIAPKTMSLGMTVDFGHHKNKEDPSYQKNFILLPDLQYFVKENRAIVGGFLFSSYEYTYQGNFVGRPALYKVNDQGVGGFVGIRNLYPIKEKFYLFTDFGLMYSRFKSEQTITDNPNSSISNDYDNRSYRVRGYAGLGLLYFLNQKFSLETNLLNAGISYSTPLGDQSVKVHHWNFDIDGRLNNLSFGLRYYF